jgi:hypothetical protein
MKKKGLTLVELMVMMTLMAMVSLGASALFLSGLRSFDRTTVDIDISQKNAQGIRRVVETVREAVTVSISNNGQTLTYTLPARTAAVDPVTGEREYVDPPVSDGVTRSFVIANGELRSNPGNRLLVRNILTADPEPGSSQFEQPYSPFQLTTIGSRRAITVNIITGTSGGGTQRYARMKTTVLVRNAQ